MPRTEAQALAEIERQWDEMAAKANQHPEAVDYWAYMPIERVKGAARVVGVTAVLIAAGIGAAGAQPSQCKGLAKAQCDSNAACRWVPERRAGETKRRDGAAHKSSARAHCRKR
jgi:hypothetical protein